MNIPANSLNELMEYLRRAEGSSVDWTDLPTFGGEEPRDTLGVWSWDEDSLLVGTCADDLEVVARSEYFGDGE